MNICGLCSWQQQRIDHKLQRDVTSGKQVYHKQFKNSSEFQFNFLFQSLIDLTFRWNVASSQSKPNYTKSRSNRAPGVCFIDLFSKQITHHILFPCFDATFEFVIEHKWFFWMCINKSLHWCRIVDNRTMHNLFSNAIFMHYNFTKLLFFSEPLFFPF